MPFAKHLVRGVTGREALIGVLFLAHAVNNWLMEPYYKDSIPSLAVWGSQMVLLTLWAVLGPLPFPVYVPRLLLWCALASALALHGLGRQNRQHSADDVLVAAYLSAIAIVASLAIFGICSRALGWRIAPVESLHETSRSDARKQVGLRAIFFDTALAAGALAVVSRLKIDSWTLRSNGDLRFDVPEILWFLFIAVTFESATFCVARLLLARAADRATRLWAVGMVVLFAVPLLTVWLLTRPNTRWPEMIFVLTGYTSFALSLLVLRLAGYRLIDGKASRLQSGDIAVASAAPVVAN